MSPNSGEASGQVRIASSGATKRDRVSKPRAVNIGSRPSLRRTDSPLKVASVSGDSATALYRVETQADVLGKLGAWQRGAEDCRGREQRTQAGGQLGYRRDCWQSRLAPAHEHFGSGARRLSHTFRYGRSPM